jgi:hypothetical protein
MAIAGKSGRPAGLPKTGGRQKGTPNKASLPVAEKLEALGCDPIAGMAGIAMDEKNSPETRGRYYSELAQYLYPKRKALDVSDQQPTMINVNTDLDDLEDPGEHKPGEISNDESVEVDVNDNFSTVEDSDDGADADS